MEKTIDELIESLKSDDEFIREESCAILEARSNESVEPLINALNSKKSNKQIKIYSAKILGIIGNDKAIDPLISALKDNNKFVRREASTALSKMGNKVVDPLIAILKDDDWKVRGAAAWALGNIGDKKAETPLKNLLDDESGFVKTGANWALGKLNK